MNICSPRYIDLAQYKTKEILLRIIRERRIDLVPANKAETRYKARCPFHKGKGPSFKIHNNHDPQVWLFKCFGCGRSGDVFSFLQMYERWEFWDAMVYVVKNCIPPRIPSITDASYGRQLSFDFPYLP